MRLTRAYPYEQIAAHYRDAIVSGRLSPGDELPSVRALSKQWQISVPAIQRAMDLLRGEGLIRSRPGKAPVVVGPPT